VAIDIFDRDLETLGRMLEFTDRFFIIKKTVL